MKKLILLLAIVLTSFLKAQNNEADLNEAKIALKNFYVTGSHLDAKKLTLYMSANYQEINDGNIVSADSLIQNVTENAKIVKSEKGKYKRTNHFKFITAWVNGNVAWVTYYLKSVEVYNETTEETYAIESTVLEKEKGAWKVVNLHSTVLKNSPEWEQF